MRRQLTDHLLFSMTVLVGCSMSMSDELDHLIDEYRGDRPGAALLVMRGDEVAVERFWGLADLGSETRVEAETNFRLASVTKQFTATAILLLASRGEIALDESIERWFPEIPHAEEITIRHLLTHASGVADYEEWIPEGRSEQLRDAEVPGLVAQAGGLHFDPGTSYRYSNSGYALLALIIEEVSGSTFSEFLRDQIFVPLGMEGSVAHVAGSTSVSRRAYGHSRTGAGWVRDDQSLTSAVLGDGGIYSSVADLKRWISSFDSDAILSDEWRALLTTPSVATDRDGVSYGFGWRIDADGALWHTGSTRGFRNVILRDPASKLTVVVLTNRNEGDVHRLARRVLAMFSE